MAQRGGSVYCTVRMGNVSGPLIASGKADVILGLEPAEALRYIKYANRGTKVVVDINPIVPFTVTVGDDKYPNLKDIYREIRKRAILYKIDASKIAKEAGAFITKNIVMLGALSATKVLPFDSHILLDTILENVPLKYKSVNKKAFEGGMSAIK
jgi:indolepyruvate ferredoxin oxidoreductase beta subunit